MRWVVAAPEVLRIAAFIEQTALFHARGLAVARGSVGVARRDQCIERGTDLGAIDAGAELSADTGARGFGELLPTELRWHEHLGDDLMQSRVVELCLYRGSFVGFRSTSFRYASS